MSDAKTRHFRSVRAKSNHGAVGNVSDVAQSLLNSQSYYNSALEEYRVNRTGPMTMATASNMVFLSLRELSPTNYTAIATSATNQQAELFLPATYTAHPELLAGFLTQRSILAQHFLRPDAGIVEMPFGAAPYQGGAVAIQRPLSRGTVMITSNDSLVDPGRSSPAIDFGALMNPLDAQIGVLAVRAIRRLFSNETVLGQVRQPVEVAPTARAETDEQLEAVLRRAASASWAHPCCTAHMAPRELGGVIDAKLRVYGVTGLRVVDASVMPTIPGGHLQSTVYAVAEKAADILLGRG